MKKNKIYSQKNSTLNAADRIEIARLLIKAGYAVRLGKEKPSGKQNRTYTYFIEYWEETENE